MHTSRHLWPKLCMSAAKLSVITERPPVVAVLGHVDHGKSTLLDYIRKTNTVAKEAGGITQHVAAYEVTHPSTGSGQAKKITFIDTPGHAAFSAIRARGANVADVCILVVAADDGVKAQTLEALEQIRAAKTPFVVAINKIDKPTADLSRTQASLLEQHVYLEQFGGDVPWAAVSAKSGQGVTELLDLILLVAEVQELRGDRGAPATGYVIEAHRDKKRGIAATLILKNGTLESGEYVRAGHGISPVRIMEDHTGASIKEASFSTPVLLVGFDELPAVGSEFHTHKSKREAEQARNEDTTLTDAQHLCAMDDNPDIFQLPIILRADTTGSLDAILQETAKIGDAGRRVRIVHSGIGNVSEDDIKAALASTVKSLPAHVIAFNVGMDTLAKGFALERGVSVETFDIIYKLTERLQELLIATAPKREIETMIGRARVLKYFSSKHDEHLFGAKVLEGEIRKNAKFRIMRKEGKVIRGTIISIQSNKQSVEKIAHESEFGAVMASETEPAAGDVIECVEISHE